MNTSDEQLDELATAVGELVRECRGEAEMLGIRVELTGPILDDPALPEMRVYFWRADKLIDVVEFPLVTSSGPWSGLDEAKAWLSDTFSDVLTCARDTHP